MHIPKRQKKIRPMVSVLPTGQANSANCAWCLLFFELHTMRRSRSETCRFRLGWPADAHGRSLQCARAL